MRRTSSPVGGRLTFDEPIVPTSDPPWMDVVVDDVLFDGRAPKRPAFHPARARELRENRAARPTSAATVASLYVRIVSRRAGTSSRNGLRRIGVDGTPHVLCQPREHARHRRLARESRSGGGGGAVGTHVADEHDKRCDFRQEREGALLLGFLVVGFQHAAVESPLASQGPGSLVPPLRYRVGRTIDQMEPGRGALRPPTHVAASRARP